MTQRYFGGHNQRGEVAWLLTVVSMVVIGFGLVIGFNISTQEQAAIRLAPQAQTLVSGSLDANATPTPRADDSKQPTNHHNICFMKKDGKNVAPGVGANLFDKLCEANFLPFKITVDSKGEPSVRARASQNQFENPTYLTNQSRVITVPSINNTNISVAGTLCVKENVKFNPADLVNTDVYASAVAADPEAPTTIATQVKAFKIAGTSGPERDSSARNFLKLANPGQDICTYDFDKTTPAQPTNSTNPILMKLYLNKGEVGKEDASILGQIERARKAGKWDAAECSIYIHADTNPGDAIDVYNIAKLDLRKFLTGEEVNQICPPNTPTMTPPPSITPTATPVPLSCSQSCTPSGTSCGTYTDPATGKDAPLGCLNMSTDYVSICTDDEFGRSACQCGPMKCVGPRSLCTSDELACGKRVPTKKLPPPQVTPTVVPQAMQCTYNALAFVEECLDVNEVTGKCELKGARKNAKAFAANILDPNPQNADRSDKWGTSNNLQRKNTEQPGGLRPVGMIPATIFSYFDGSKVASTLRSRFFNFPFNTTQAPDGGVAYEPISAIDVDSTQAVETQAKTLKDQVKELTTRTDIKIEHVSELPTQNRDMYLPEQYTNFTNADVRLDYDDVNYKILPDGKQVYSCTNTLIAQVDPNDKRAKGVGACLPQPTSSPTDADRRDTISGLTVGCGQNIVYGWTLQKCNFDFDIVLVVDTSSSMTFDKNGTQRRKIDIAKDQLKEFVDFAQANYGPKTRISLVSFNAAESYSPSTGTTDNGKGKISDFVPLKNNDSQPNVSGVANLKASIDNLQTVEGTCIQCGLRNAQSYLQKRSEPDLRLPVLVLLSDGRSNAFPGAKSDNPVRGQIEPNPGDEVAEIHGLADAIRADGVTTKADGSRNIDNNQTIKDDTLFVAFGYGDSKLAADNNDSLLFDMLNSLVSYRRDSRRAFDLSKRWIYTTDRGGNSDEIQVQTIVSQIKTDLNSCSQLSLAYDNVQKAKDVNNDGIVNTIDLFLVFDNYFAKGQNLKEDINADGVVNINDVTLIVESLGTVVTPADKAVTGADQPTQ